MNPYKIFKQKFGRQLRSSIRIQDNLDFFVTTKTMAELQLVPKYHNSDMKKGQLYLLSKLNILLSHKM